MIKTISKSLLLQCMVISLIFGNPAIADSFVTTSVSKIDRIYFTDQNFDVSGDIVSFGPNEIEVLVGSDRTRKVLARLKKRFGSFERLKVTGFNVLAISDLGVRSSRGTYSISKTPAQVVFDDNLITLQTDPDIHAGALEILRRDKKIYFAIRGKKKYGDGFWSLSFGLVEK